SFSFRVPGSNTLILPNGVIINSGVNFTLDGGGTVEVGNTQAISVNGGGFIVLGTIDSFPQAAGNKGKVTVQGGAGSWGLNSSSGSVRMRGFQFDRMDTNGVIIGGSTSLVQLDGGQFTNLSTSYASVRSIQINTTGAIPAASDKVAWSWNGMNDFEPHDLVPSVNTPTTTDAYTLLFSSGCAGQSMDFGGFTGDWMADKPTFDITTKVNSSACSLTLGLAASAVSLLSYEAVPYNGAIDIRWRTNFEQNHLGFNIYRSNEEGTEFLQINDQLIRNWNSAGSAKGDYRFVDNDVINGQRYYYYLEDIEVDQITKTLHGPVFAMPLASLGAPPVDAVDENSESNPNQGGGGATDPGTIPNPSFKDLGNGVVILSQTSKSLRIEITPATTTFSVSGWNGAYEDVAIPGYAVVADPGNPEVLERDLLIEVYNFATVASLTNSAKLENTLNGHLITPAPLYTVDGNGDLQPSYVPNATSYALNSYGPTQFFEVSPNLIKSGGKTYLRVKVYPLRFNPVLQSVRKATKITLDIGLDGNAWEVDPPASGSVIDPFLVANTLRVDYTKAGVYELSYDDLVDSNVEGPFDGTDVYELRLYHGNNEIPIDVSSATGNFASGDYLRFFVPFEESIEDVRNRVILSTIEINETAMSPQRMSSFDATPTGVDPSDETHSWYTKAAEEDWIFITRESVLDSLDHFFWKDMFSFPGFDTLNFTIALPELDPASSENVEVKVFLKGIPGILGDVQHHLTLDVNNTGTVLADVSFSNHIRESFILELPASHFIQGNNNLSLKAAGTYAPAGDYDRMYIDKVEVRYQGTFISNNGTAAYNLEDGGGATVTSGGFSSPNVSIYDVTDYLNVYKMINASITTSDGGATYDVEYVTSEENEDFNRNYVLVEDGKALSPSGLSLTPGFPTSLKNTLNQADLIIIGHATLLGSMSSLIEQRQAQGLVVFSATLDQIYAEFSDGRVSSKALQDFINYTQSSWALPRPSYLILVGDATFDPRDRNVDGWTDLEKSVKELGTMPMPIVEGRFADFGADNYFAISDASHLPQLAVGRIPSNNPAEIEGYVQKVLDYENALKRPTDKIKNISFVVDADTAWEKFRSRTDNLASVPNIHARGFTTEIFDHAVLGSGAALKTEILGQFADPPFIMSMMGHGAYDRWGQGTLMVADADALTNTKLPVVIMWNCESGYFYDAYNADPGLGERLVLNPNGGAVVFLGSTAQTTPTAQIKLAEAFYQEIARVTNLPHHGVRIGDIFFKAKVATGPGSYEKDIINSFSMLGDPSMPIPAELFAPTVSNIPEAVEGGGGCSVGASDGTAIPWQHGVLEWLFLISLIFIPRRLGRLLKNR
ncbi:MAG: hypothetical protein HOM21_07240, partial [Halobacteriovoraceae bacterium]|nr:hypothetical protein [Halobacteriovoraceae bacterium]